MAINSHPFFSPSFISIAQRELNRINRFIVRKLGKIISTKVCYLYWMEWQAWIWIVAKQKPRTFPISNETKNKNSIKLINNVYIFCGWSVQICCSFALDIQSFEREKKTNRVSCQNEYLQITLPFRNTSNSHYPFSIPVILNWYVFQKWMETKKKPNEKLFNSMNSYA